MSRDDEAAVRAFRVRFGADRLAGRVRPLSDYQRMFRGFDAAVARAYDELQGPAVPQPSVAGPAPAPAGDAAPDVVGHYRIVRELGSGGQGTVYLAEDVRLARPVALKLLAPGLLSSAGVLDRFRREAAAMSRLDHPGICTVFEAGEARGVPYIAMRYVDGETLAARIAAARAATRPSDSSGDSRRTGAASTRPDVMHLVKVAEKTARALHAAHEAGLIHRDVKPANVMVARDGEPVVLDFGLAREEEVAGAGLTMTGTLLGTPAYMSPEQLTAQRIRLDRRTDVYSLGVTLYEALTLRLPFDAPTRERLYQKILASEAADPRKLNPAITRDLRVVLETAMAKDRDRRYESALGLAEDLRCVRELRPIRARPIGRVLRVARWARRNVALAATLGALLLSLAAGLGVSLWLLSEARDERDAKDRAGNLARDALVQTAREKAEKTTALRKARALGLVNASAVATQSNPALALLLAREAVRFEPTPDSWRRLREAVSESRERARFRAHDGALRGLVFSPRGDALLTLGLRDGLARLWRLDGTRIAEFRHDGAVDLGDLAPSGQYVLTAASDGTIDAKAPTRPTTVRLWDLEGREIAKFHHEYAVTSASFAPAGDRVLTASNDRTARVWDLSGRELFAVRHERAVTAARWSPRGDRFVTTSKDGSARIWTAAGEPVAELGPFPQEVLGAAWSPSGDRVATWCAADAGLRAWTSAGEPLGGFRGPAEAVAFLPGGQLVVATSPFGVVTVVDPAKGALVATLSGDVSYGLGAAVPGRGRHIVTLHTSGVLAWDAASLRPTRIAGCPRSAGIGASAVSPDGETVAVWTAEGEVWCADVEDRSLACVDGFGGYANVELGGGRGSFTSFFGQVAPSRDRLLCVDGGRGVLVDLDGRRVQEFGSDGDRVYGAWFSASGSRVLTGSVRRGRQVWDLAGRLVAELAGVEPLAVSGTFATPSGDRLFAVAAGGAVHVWDAGGRELTVLGGHASPISFAAAARDGRLLFTFSAPAKAPEAKPALLKVWDRDGHELGAFAGDVGFTLLPGLERWGLFERGRIRCFDLDLHDAGPWPSGLVVPSSGRAHAYPANGRMLDGIKGLRLRDGDGRLVATLSEAGRAIAASATLDAFLLTDADGGTRVFDRDGRCVATLYGHDRTVMSVAYAPAAARIATATEDGTLRIWDVDGRLLGVVPTGGSVLALEFVGADARVLATVRYVLAGVGASEARAWIVPTREADLVALAKARSFRDLTPDERRRYAALLDDE